MSAAEMREILGMVHWAALVPALAMAISADLVALGSLRRPLGPRALGGLGRLHRGLLVALAVLWVSGLAMVALRLGPLGTGLTPKVLVKLGAVGILSLNAVAIGRIVLPGLAAQRDRCFGAFPAPLRMRLALIGAVSSACWAGALALGTIGALAEMGLADLALVLGPVLAAALSGGVLMALTAPWFMADEGRAAPAPA
jgi:hypothetical protein